MVATVPGDPQTAYVRCLGLKGLLSLTLVSAYEGRLSEPKMPCKRDTTNPPAAITTSTSSGIHSRPRTLKIVNPLHLSTPGAVSAARPCNYTSAATRQTADPRMRWVSPAGCAAVTANVGQPRGAQPDLDE